MARLADSAQQPKSNPASGLGALHVYSICRESVPAVGQDRLILTCLRSGDRKLQSIARWTEKNPKVRKDLHVYSAPDRKEP